MPDSAWVHFNVLIQTPLSSYNIDFSKDLWLVRQFVWRSEKGPEFQKDGLGFKSRCARHDNVKFCLILRLSKHLVLWSLTVKPNLVSHSKLRFFPKMSKKLELDSSSSSSSSHFSTGTWYSISMVTVSHFWTGLSSQTWAKKNVK